MTYQEVFDFIHDAEVDAIRVKEQMARQQCEFNAHMEQIQGAAMIIGQSLGMNAMLILARGIQTTQNDGK